MHFRKIYMSTCVRDTDMDRSWMEIVDRRRPEYQNGVKQFLDFAYAHIEPEKKIQCPCLNCNNVYFRTQDEVRSDLYVHGIVKGYTKWVFHGEKEYGSNTNDDDFYNKPDIVDEDGHGEMQGMMPEHYTAPTVNARTGEDSNNNGNALPDSAADKDMRLLKDAEQKLYPGCENYTNLSFISKLLHLKKDNRWSDESCTMVLELLKEALPDGESLPSSYSEAERIIRDQGLENMTEDQKSEEVLRRGQAGHMRGHGACPKPTTSTAGQRICTQLKRKKKGIRRHAEAATRGLESLEKDKSEMASPLESQEASPLESQCTTIPQQLK